MKIAGLKQWDSTDVGGKSKVAINYETEISFGKKYNYAPGRLTHDNTRY